LWTKKAMASPARGASAPRLWSGGQESPATGTRMVAVAVEDELLATSTNVIDCRLR
jgi:hypothetical protein